MPSNIKVMLVDDNPMVLEMLRQALAHFSTVQPMNDAADALLKAIEEKPDLIIADYAMEGMDGRQLLQKIKSRNASAGIPVMLMASKTDINEKLKAVQDTVEDFIEKPFFLKEAAAKIKKVVDKISLEKMARGPSANSKIYAGGMIPTIPSWPPHAGLFEAVRRLLFVRRRRRDSGL